ncbi:MAG: hypothetical protein RBR67_19835 [Desulfobacterium sp.]|jgi:hypothetical protein|nr:hypothetical protein [Desulfobacterium sp.]
MLKSTFLHLKGIGKKTERTLWNKGITTWEVYAASFQKQLSLFSEYAVNNPISESIAAYENDDLSFFAKTLPASEYYRIALEFPQDVLKEFGITGDFIHTPVSQGYVSAKYSQVFNNVLSMDKQNSYRSDFQECDWKIDEKKGQRQGCPLPCSGNERLFCCPLRRAEFRAYSY